MTKLQKRLESLAKCKSITSLQYDSLFVNQDNRHNSLFWGGCLINLVFKYQHKVYHVFFKACGDVIGYLLYNNELIRIKDKSETGELGRILENTKIGDKELIVKDIFEMNEYVDLKTEEIKKEVPQPIFFADNNNWYELQVFNELGKLLTDGMDIQEYEDAFITVETLREFLKINEFGLPKEVVFTATDLELDTDDEFENNDILEDRISNLLSDTYGYCHFGFKYRKVYNELKEPAMVTVYNIRWDTTK